MGGELVMALAEATGARILPVDSEHSALFQLVEAERPGTVERLVLTASGGPFRGRTDLSGITVARTRSRTPPGTWAARSRVDSATLMNKGLEVIEAHHLFGMPYDRIDVVVHPAVDRALPDPPQRRRLARPPRATRTCGCRSPTRCTIPSARTCRWSRWTWRASARWTSRRPTRTRSPACAWPARPAIAGGTAPCVLNAANEVAVARVPRRAPAVHRHRRGDRAHARSDAGRCRGPLRRALRASTPRPATRAARRWSRAPAE